MTQLEMSLCAVRVVQSIDRRSVPFVLVSRGLPPVFDIDNINLFNRMFRKKVVDV